MLPGMRNDHQGHLSRVLRALSNLVDSQADTIQRDRAFFHHITAQ